MCEVTNENFSELYNQIKADLQAAKFVAIDSEFSALSAGNVPSTSLFHSPAERYAKLHSVVKKIVPVQVGLTAFAFKPDENEFVGKVYTFYTYPRSFFSIDRSFQCQSSSLQFLCDHNFDFNKFVYKGISYLNRQQEAAIRATLSNQSANVSSEFQDDALEFGQELSQWFHNSQLGDVCELPAVLKKFPNNIEALYVVHKTLREKFSKAIWTYEENGSFFVRKVALAEYEALDKRNNLEEAVVNQLLGFSKVFRLICNLSKPVVGHNLLMDLMLLTNTFDEPLPPSYREFKRQITRLLPCIFDTKTISFELLSKIPKGKRWENGGLGSLYNYFKDGSGRHLAPLSPLIQAHVASTSDDFHNAGWDSYFTGYIFLRMAHLYASEANKTVKRKFMSSELFHAIAPLKNKANVIRCSTSYIQLDGEDPQSRRPPFLIIESLTNEPINLGQMTVILSSCGSVEVKSFSSRGQRAIIAVDNYNSEKRILKQFKQNNKFRIERYNVLKHSHGTKIVLWSSVIASAAAMLFWCTMKKL